MAHRVGILIGNETTFPDALIDTIDRRNAGVSAEYAAIEPPRSDGAPAYDVILDRISHVLPHFQPWLKLCALRGARVVNDPFWCQADDKFFDAALAHQLGVAAPATCVLPPADIPPDALTSMWRVDWEAMAGDLGFPMFVKPARGGAWRDVARVSSVQELRSAAERAGRMVMIVQEEIEWAQYVRCFVIGGSNVRVALWDPRLTHFERYLGAAETMPALAPELEARVKQDASKICTALGYDVNTVEFAIRDGVPFAIDFMNPVPDMDVTSVGERHFEWVVDAIADLCIARAHEPPVDRWRWGR
jgi:glutathione synthase/RimK-type ligase-like ATP-grasp enzyme